MQRSAVQAIAAVLVCLSLITCAAAATVRATVLRASFYTSVLDRSNTVERLYDQVLVDPDLIRLRTDLSAGQARAVHVAVSAVGVNIRLALPPDTVRALLSDQLDALVAWLRGDTDTLRLEVSLEPIIQNLHGLAASYVSEVLAATPSLRTTTVPALRKEIGALVAEVRAGRRPTVLPSLANGSTEPKAVERLLAPYLPPDLRTRLAPLLRAALESGDGRDALALVLDQSAIDRAARVGADLLRMAHGRKLSLTSYLHAAIPASTVRTMETVRWWLDTPLLLVLVLAAVVGLTSVAVLVLGSAAPPRRRAVRAGIALAAGAVLSAALAVAAWWWFGSIVDDLRRRSWPSSVRGLAVDNAKSARSIVLDIWLQYTAGLLVIGMLVGMAALSMRWRPAHEFRFRIPRPTRRYVAVGAAAAVLVAAAVVVWPSVARNAQRCNGATYLCDRPYNQVVELTTHNAMANTEDRFLFPLQDPDIETQLNAGARALQLDSWTWETPEQVAGRLVGAQFPPRAVAVVRRLAEIANPRRPGVWLCHDFCRLGALPLVGTLVALRKWLQRNPREVVTIILQDETPAARTVAAIRAAHLVPDLARPPASPRGRWPTLGQMIASGRRLVMFTENAKNAAPWLQNFYKYAEETPFAFSSLQAMKGAASCVPNRGGTGRPLFLLNNFVTVPTGSRLDSAQANSAKFLQARIDACAALRKRRPTFIAVDFASLGQAQSVVNDLNRNEP